jgi:hypothetical protein
VEEGLLDDLSDHLRTVSCEEGGLVRYDDPPGLPDAPNYGIQVQRLQRPEVYHLYRYPPLLGPPRCLQGLVDDRSEGDDRDVIALPDDAGLPQPLDISGEGM